MKREQWWHDENNPKETQIYKIVYRYYNDSIVRHALIKENGKGESVIETLRKALGKRYRIIKCYPLEEEEKILELDYIQNSEELSEGYQIMSRALEKLKASATNGMVIPLVHPDEQKIPVIAEHTATA
jgi:hypothetical protein